MLQTTTLRSTVLNLRSTGDLTLCEESKVSRVSRVRQRALVLRPEVNADFCPQSSLLVQQEPPLFQKTAREKVALVVVVYVGNILEQRTHA